MKKVIQVFPRNEFQYLEVPDPIFNNVVVIRKNGESQLTIKQDSDRRYVTKSQIILNPRRYKSYSGLSQVLSGITDIKSLEISRLDHKVDLPYPLGYLYSGINIKYKQDFSKFKEEKVEFKRSELTGFYFGKRPEIYAFYDKGYHLKKFKLKRDKKFPLGEFSRIELRQEKGKVKYKDFCKLRNYLQDSPFKHIEFSQVDLSSSCEKAILLRQEVNELGFFIIKKQKNKQSNFTRNNKNHINKVNIKEEIDEEYKKGLIDFFKEE